jgi:tetratricopeptide (TPR) repeat protein
MAKKTQNKPIPQPVPVKPVAKSMPRSAVAAEVKQPVSLNMLCLVLAGICLVIYFNSLWGGYVLDDVMVLKDNTMVTQGTKAIGELLGTPHMRGYLVIPNDMWRPLSLVMFAIEYQVFGLNPVEEHFMNIVFYIGCVLAFFIFLDKFFDRKKTAVAFIAALVFAVHPIHTEIVANIKSRDELMCFFFAFLSLNLFMNYMKDGKIMQLVLGVLAFFLSLMSKETVLTFLAVIPLLFFFYDKRDGKRAIFIMAGTVAATIVFIAIRSSILSQYNANQPAPVEFIDNALSGAPSAASKFATEIVILGKYLKLMFIPYPLLCNYSYNSIPFADLSSPWFWLSLVAYGAMIYFGITRWMKNKKDPWTFGIVVYLASISLFSNLPFLMGAELAERFTFFATSGICLLIALAVEQWIIKAGATDIALLKSTKVLAVLVPLCLLFSVMTIARNFDWKDDYTLYRVDSKNSPNDARLHHYLATAEAENAYNKEPDTLKKKQMDIESLEELRKSLAIYPTYSEAYVEMGRIFDRQHRWDSAEFYDVKALAANPDNATANNNLGSVYLASAKYDLAVKSFRKSMGLNPNFRYAYFNIARAFTQLKLYDSAIKYYTIMLGYDPNYFDAQQEIAMDFFSEQRFDSAESHFKIVLALKPNDANVTNNMGATYLNSRRYPQAIEMFKKSIEIDPKFESAYSNLGRAYYFSAQYQAAIDVFNKQLAINPKNGSNVPYIALSYQKMGNMEMAKKYEVIAKQIYSNFKLE